MIINTSFNVRGEPIVATRGTRFHLFYADQYGYLLLGNFLLEKRDRKPFDKDIDWLREFELD